MAQLKPKHSTAYETALDMVEMATPEVAREIKTIFADETIPLENLSTVISNGRINNLKELTAVLKKLKRLNTH